MKAKVFKLENDKLSEINDKLSSLEIVAITPVANDYIIVTHDGESPKES